MGQKYETSENQHITQKHINQTNNSENNINKKNGQTAKKGQKRVKKTPYILCFEKKCLPLQSILDNGDRKINKLKDS
ncbi:MAG: hypothetical protein IJN98_01220 [Alistipes sp.]|nr:hypothetical protein [Alistipes sp.]